MLLICCFLIERLLTFTLECFAWLSCYVNLCFCLPQRLFRRQQPGCDVTATEWFFFVFVFLEKDKINRLNVKWPFLWFIRGSFAGSTNVNKFWMGMFAWFVPGDHSVPPGHTLTPSDLFQLSHNEPEGDADCTVSIPLAKPCLCVWPVKPWVTEKWCELWLLSGCSARERTHCLALCSDCQSVSLSICHSISEHNELK